MSLVLHFHPLSSFCQKVLFGLYELDVPFEKHLVDLGNESERSALLELWPIGKFPVLRDDARDWTLPESSIILEYLDQHYAGRARLIPSDPDAARECRLADRFYDSYVSVPMQKIVGDKLRAEGQRDAYGVEQAKAQLDAAYAFADDQLRTERWKLGDAASLADCAAAPALFYAGKLVPFGTTRPHLAAYFQRLVGRPTFARVLEEAKPYLALFPG